MENIESKSLQLSKVFCADFNFRIPYFQRPYDWDEKEIVCLFDCLYESWNDNPNNTYFLGSIVLAKSEESSCHEVIDGQQRLTTLSILYSVLSRYFANAHQSQWKDSTEKILREPGDVGVGREPSVRLKLRTADQEYFEEIVQDPCRWDLSAIESAAANYNDSKTNAFHAALAKNFPLPENPSQILILKNTALMSELIRNRFTKNQTDEIDIEKLQSFTVFLNTCCYLVTVCTRTKEFAIQIFSVMNSTGKNLIASDLIKADVIEMLDDAKRKQYSDKWEECENELGRDGFQTLFNKIMMIFAPDENLRDRTNLGPVGVWKKYIKNNFYPEEFIDNKLIPYSQAFSIIRNGNYELFGDARGRANESLRLQINSTLGWLNRLPNDDHLPVAIKFMAEKKYSPDQICVFLKKLERMAACFMTIGIPRTTSSNRYEDIIRQMEIAESIEDIKALELNDDEKVQFWEKLNGDIYNMNTKKRMYLMLRLDSFMSDDATTYDRKKASIEHVLPQTIDAGSEWSKDWNDEEKALWLHRLGNLAMLTRANNSRASNQSFSEKKKLWLGIKGGMTTYNLTRQLLNVNDWTPGVVEERQIELMNVFAEKYELQPVVSNLSIKTKKHDVDDLPSEPSKKKNTFLKLRQIMESGYLKAGDKIGCTVVNTNVSCTLLEDANVRNEKGIDMSLQQWLKEVTGWMAVETYKYSALLRTGETLDEIRNKIGK